MTNFCGVWEGDAGGEGVAEEKVLESALVVVGKESVLGLYLGGRRTGSVEVEGESILVNLVRGTLNKG